MLMWVEEAQSMQRAENGIREIVLGYIGHETEDVLTADNDLSELIPDFDDAGTIQRADVADLPDDVRSVYLAEMHRLKTGEVLKSREFRELEVKGVE